MIVSVIIIFTCFISLSNLTLTTYSLPHFSLPPLSPKLFTPSLPLSLPHHPPSLTTSLHLPPELEWVLSEKGAVKTELEEDPRKKKEIKDMMTMAIRGGFHDAEDSDEDCN